MRREAVSGRFSGFTSTIDALEARDAPQNCAIFSLLLMLVTVSASGL